ncbi:MAG: sigma-70 family RNA polymerase sigma factor [Proteobacteria bacterium]|jgi:RNA polymerase sigma-70 factor (ECF subfamily)|nr:sigma-70 family RNA polymerase sigma factor [Pseudomonadota bacterium]
MDTENKKDLQVLKKIGEGSEQDFLRLYHKYKKNVYGLSYKILQTKALAEEVTQEVWMKVVQNAARFEALPGTVSQNPVKAWILQITRNQCLNLLEKKSTWEISSESESDLLNELSAGGDPDEELQVLENEALLNQWIDELPEIQRACLVLWISSEKSYGELAKELKLTETHVKVLIHRAKQNLKRQRSQFLKRGDVL